MWDDLYRKVLFRDSATTFVLSTSILLLTTTGFLALSISLRSIYLWLVVVFVALILLAAFTCACSLPLHGSDTFTCPDTMVPNVSGNLATLPAQVSRYHQSFQSYIVLVNLLYQLTALELTRRHP